MANFWKLVNKVIKESDLLLMVIDSRMIEKTRNIEVEDKIRKAEKKIIYVFNKCDLVEKDWLEKKTRNIRPGVFVSSKEYFGTGILRERIYVEAKKAGIKNEPLIIGVLGYPNTGKSSLINAMKGKKSASTSSTSGHTKGLQKIRSEKKITFIDTPGVIPYNEKDESKHQMISAIDYNKAKDPDLVVMQIIEEEPGLIERFYDVPITDDVEETVSNIAIKLNMLKKEGLPDLDRASRQVLKDWQTGKIKNN